MPADPETPTPEGAPLTRRQFIVRTGATAAGLAWLGAADPRPGFATHHEKPALPIDLLEASPFVYISPLRRDGNESTCHAEVWYAWLDGGVVVTVASNGWKATSVAKGLDRARIWVGDHGRVKSWIGGPNEGFRKAPHFDARAEKVSDPELLERLLASYEKKYPAEISSWRDRMRRGNADGTRVLLRYSPA